ncbi:MAG: LLM class flavin-dependent oxidoreductase [Chloroflexi bacterium]|nr:LLM class flavin-dependent oxidoreductase [Chloroflexota bacterium]
MSSFRCFLMGEGTLLIQCAAQLESQGHTILGIITSHDTIVSWAETHHIPVYHPQSDWLTILGQRPFDYFFSIANLSIVPEAVLRLPEQMAINFHDGPLPRYAGLNATSWAILNQEMMHGITWHEMVAGLDEGRILLQRHFPLVADETAFTLNARCYTEAAASFTELLESLSTGQLTPQPQDFTQRTYFGKNQRPFAAANLRWSQSAEQLSALVRALTFGPVPNPLTLPKVKELLVGQLSVTDTPSQQAPGVITQVTPAGVQVATTTYDVILSQFRTLNGQPAEPVWTVGTILPDLDEITGQVLTSRTEVLARQEPFWRQALSQNTPLEIPYLTVEPTSESLARATAYPTQLDCPLPGEWQAAAAATQTPLPTFAAALFGLYLARLVGQSQLTVGFHDHQIWQESLAPFPDFAPVVPLNLTASFPTSGRDNLRLALSRITRTQKGQSYARDLIPRTPELAAAPTYPLIISLVSHPPVVANQPTAAILVTFTDNQCQWHYHPAYLTPADAERMVVQFITFGQQLLSQPERPLSLLSLLNADEQQEMLVAWNNTQTSYPRDRCLHHLFEQQVTRTPDAVAVVSGPHQLTYRQLNSRANQLAHYLQQQGVGPESCVGLYLDRSLELMVALLAVLKAGAAYLPLDPDYPTDRLAFMLSDAAAPVILTQAHLQPALPPHQAQVICLDSGWSTISQYPSHSTPTSAVKAANLAYVIYTSGSTGQPKGVMIEHRQVLNFFAGMDDHIPHNPPGTWLAVTSLSFDISVLELFWTLCRGFKVVLYAEKWDAAATPTSRPLDFSLFYFASDAGENPADKYRILLEGAKFADQNGFAAIWTPERHFGAFGGLYPNPAVASAAIAAITQNVKIRAGSCVSPLHHPIRITEEWSLVDNLSNGRVGISFAAGWQPNDFVLRPETFADRKNQMFRDIEIIHKLWQGEAVTFPGPNGRDVTVRTLPHPIQPHLPTWVTAAGNPETFQMAGAKGYNLLTHLLGQSTSELAEKIALYRQAWQEAGHAGQGQLTLMLHTFVGDNTESVREIVREPMKQYLASALDLTEKAAWSFPTFKDKAQATGLSLREMFSAKTLSDEEKNAILDHAFERYFADSGLFGPVERCLELVNQLKAIGVDEIACLIDYGVPSELVLRHLPYLNQVRQAAQPAPTSGQDLSFAALIRQHNVNYLQCTPSMAQMFLHNEQSRAAFRQLEVLCVGGEAFPVALADELRDLVSGRILNMYGPTETTIWSAVSGVDPAVYSEGHTVPIGHPIANTSLFILDAYGQPTPVGVAGELFIGGEGVARGYLNRPALTAERFVAYTLLDVGNQHESGPQRLYRTGDLARYRADGAVEFLGRNDFQVKIRGYRIELGEIERHLHEHPAIKQAVVVAREDIPGNKQLVAYLVARAGQTIDRAAIREFVRGRVPTFMVPAHFITLPTFPLTPNRKIDRKALPAPQLARAQAETHFTPPANDMEAQIAAIWQELLGLDHVGMDDNFFDIGGHSILAVQAHRLISEKIARPLSVTDLFRFTTIRALAHHLGQNHDPNQGTETDLQQTLDRAERRRQQLQRRVRG